MYVDVVLPLALPGQFTYRLPAVFAGQVAVGSRVEVPFGSRKSYTAIVARVYDEEPTDGFDVKDVSDVLDGKPLVLPLQLDFWQWLSYYYMCTPGEVMRAALPSGLKLESETVVTLCPGETSVAALTDKERQVLAHLSDGRGCSVQELEKLASAKHLLPLVRQLISKGMLSVRESLATKYRPKMEVYVRLANGCRDEKTIHEWLDQLKKAPKQQALLTVYLELSKYSEALTLQNPSLVSEVSRAELLRKSGASSAVLAALCQRGVLEMYSCEISRLKGSAGGGELHELSEAQRTAFRQIGDCFASRDVCLLHGVTSSGKTEVYIHLAQQELERGRQVLYLLPEIALTTQITDRLGRVFGGRMGVYHSKFPDAERVEIWKRQIGDRPLSLILGARSALFLPFANLGLIIVDEEHDASYKQQDPAPRYHARDAAIMLAKMSGAKVLLGTATPAVETYYNVQIGKYGSVVLDRRYGEVSMPEIVVEDVKELRRKKLMKTPFSPRLTEEIREALARKEQVILFQNRRGYAPVVSCRACGWVPRCQKCDVCLTYHQRPDRLVCHYCGATYAVPRQCPQCGGAELRDLGYGTEKIEAAVATCFPEARTVRMDLDTTRSRQAYERIIQDFQQGHTDILISTQMVTKGLDFDKVRVVGILNADQMMNKPDFRAYERAYQIMAQVAGRAGRRGQYGVIVVQTYQPDAPVIEQIVRNDYVGMYRVQMEERKNFDFPPFCRLINIYMKHRQESVVATASETLAGYLRPIFGDGLLGPERPVVGRVQAQYIRKIMVKLCPEISGSEVRRQLLGALTRLDMKSVTIYFDVDPV